MGTLLRNAEALRWDAVYLLDGCCDVFNDKAIRAARGATFTVSVSKGSWQQFYSLAQEAGMLLLAAAPNRSEEVPSERNEDIWDGAIVQDVLEHYSTPSVGCYVGGHATGADAVHSTGSGFSKEVTARIGDAATDSISEIEGNEAAWSSGEVEPDVASLFEQLESRKVALVLGSEGQGLRPEVLKACNRVSIPMIGETDSLNVAAAGSMLMLVLSQSLKGVLQRVQGAIST